MARKGKKPTPTKDKIGKGTYRKDRAHADEVEFDIMAENCPAPGVLDANGKQEWDRIVPQLQSRGILNVTDQSIVLAYCLEMQAYLKAKKDIEAKGEYLEAENKAGATYYAINPSVQIGNKALSNAMRIATEFGFTPSSRTRISVGGSKKTENPDEATLMRLSK